MRVLIVYYSRTGRNKRMAEVVRQKLLGDVEEIVDRRSRAGLVGWFWGGRDALLKRETKIGVVKYDPGDYDTVILVYPIWAGVMPPAVRTYVRRYRESLERVVVVSVSSQGRRNVLAVKDVEGEIGKKLVGGLWIKMGEFERGEFGQELVRLATRVLKREGRSDKVES